MNVLNETARCLRNQLEAENKKNNPNQYIIKKLEWELRKCLKEWDI